MAIGTNDLIAPAGKLQPNLFPGEDLPTYVAAWLSQAGTKLGNIPGGYQDAARAAWVYYRAYAHIADRLAGTPNSASVDSAAQVSQSIGKDRIAYFSNLSNRYLEEFEGYISTPTDATAPASTWVHNRIIF